MLVGVAFDDLACFQLNAIKTIAGCRAVLFICQHEIFVERFIMLGVMLADPFSVICKYVVSGISAPVSFPLPSISFRVDMRATAVVTMP